LQAGAAGVRSGWIKYDRHSAQRLGQLRRVTPAFVDFIGLFAGAAVDQVRPVCDIDRRSWREELAPVFGHPDKRLAPDRRQCLEKTRP
jgi:hypothetical protein